MEYSKIIAVTGLPGLYELVSSKTDGAIVRSLEDKTTRFVSSRIHSFSHLESIEVFTSRENVNLVEVLKAMLDSSEKLPDEKDADALKKYFTKTYPELDFDRVYSSDLKKMVKWFSILKNNQVDFSMPPVLEEPVPVAKPAAAPEKTATPSSEKKPVKKEATEKKEPVKKGVEKKKAEKKTPKAEKAVPAK